MINTEEKIQINLTDKIYDKENEDSKLVVYLFKDYEEVKSGIKIFYTYKKRRKLSKTYSTAPNIDSILGTSVEDFYDEMDNMYEVKDFDKMIEKLKDKYITKIDNAIISFELNHIADNQVRPTYRNFLKIINLPRPIYMKAVKEWQDLQNEIEQLKIRFLLNKK